MPYRMGISIFSSLTSLKILDPILPFDFPFLLCLEDRCTPELAALSVFKSFKDRDRPVPSYPCTVELMNEG